jgi:branched-chain amino acid transport system permease protein
LSQARLLEALRGSILRLAGTGGQCQTAPIFGWGWAYSPMVAVQVIVGGLLLGAIYALFSSGLTLIWGMMNFINFAHGEFVMLGMYVALLVVTWIGGGPAIFGIAAAVALAVLGILIYFALIREVIRGPMLAQILSTFGLALLLRYTAFWFFSANFVSLPTNALSGTVNLAGIYLPVAQLVAGLVAIALTIGLHLLLTQTTVGSKLLAVAEDRTAAMLMGIRPDRMQALAWGLSAGAAGIAGALMATAYPWSPSVGETFGLIAFVVVALGGFGSVLGSLCAGLIIGLIQAASAFWLGAIYKDIVVYGLFVALLWLRPQGLLGKKA